MSPMRRAMDTAYHIFKSHPNVKNILFKVDPLLRESVRSSADIPVFDAY